MPHHLVADHLMKCVGALLQPRGVTRVDNVHKSPKKCGQTFLKVNPPPTS
jgi:hypothetical protein